MRLSMGILALLVLLGANAGSASANAPVYPGQRPAANPELQAMISAGVTFWHERSVTIDQPVEMYIADDMGDVEDGLGATPFEGLAFCRTIRAVDYGVNRIVCRADWVRHNLRLMRDRVQGPAYVSYVCATLWHELGHMGGLALPQIVNDQWVDTHPKTGLMSQNLTTPTECRRVFRPSANAAASHAQRHARLAFRRARRSALRDEHRALRHYQSSLLKPTR